VADPRAYPIAADFRRDRILRPDARTISFIEALVRALADTTEDELDAGRWKREVTNFDGPVTLSFTLPLLIEAESGKTGTAPRPAIMPRLAERASVQMARLLGEREFSSSDEMNRALDDARQQGLFDAPPEVQAGRPLTALEQAQEVAYDATEASGRLRIKLARKALSLSPDCADACVILGNAALTPEAALEWYQRGVDAGARAIGPERLSDARDLWEHLDARPYMRARFALAQLLEASGRSSEAVDHYRDLLRMNRNDNQGLRNLLIPLLLEQRRDEEAGSLLDEYQGDVQAILPYARAIWMFRREGDSTASREALHEAIRTNRHVIGYLLEPETMPWRPSHFALGSKEEAAYTADELLAAFEQTEGALAWLQTHAHRASGRKKR
jgi:tetratricopeptide (TPR) repeat protein